MRSLLQGSAHLLPAPRLWQHPTANAGSSMPPSSDDHGSGCVRARACVLLHLFAGIVSLSTSFGHNLCFSFLFIASPSNPPPQVLAAALLPKCILNFVLFLLLYDHGSERNKSVTEVHTDGAHVLAGAPGVEEDTGAEGAHSGRPRGLPGRITRLGDGATESRSPKPLLFQPRISRISLLCIV